MILPRIRICLTNEVVSIETSLLQQIAHITVNADEESLRQVWTVFQTLLTARSVKSFGTAALCDEVIMPRLSALQQRIPKQFIVTILQMDAGYHTTLHKRHISKVPRLLLINVCHYFRVLVVMFSMYIALSPHPSENIIGECVVRIICTLGFNCRIMSISLYCQLMCIEISGSSIISTYS